MLPLPTCSLPAKFRTYGVVCHKESAWTLVPLFVHQNVTGARHVDSLPRPTVGLSKAFGSTPESWIRMQAAYDLAQAQAREDQI